MPLLLVEASGLARPRGWRRKPLATGELGILLLASLMFSRTWARKLAAVLFATGGKWKCHDGWMDGWSTTQQWGHALQPTHDSVNLPGKGSCGCYIRPDTSGLVRCRNMEVPTNVLFRAAALHSEIIKKSKGIKNRNPRGIGCEWAEADLKGISHVCFPMPSCFYCSSLHLMWIVNVLFNI